MNVLSAGQLVKRLNNTCAMMDWTKHKFGSGLLKSTHQQVHFFKCTWDPGHGTNRLSDPTGDMNSIVACDMGIN